MSDDIERLAQSIGDDVARRKRLRAFYVRRMERMLPSDWALQDANGTIIGRSYDGDDPIEAMLRAGLDYDEANDVLWSVQS